MAHRPFYRVLGETSLELKCLTLFGAFLLLVITASFLSYWMVTGKVVKRQNPNTGKVLAERTMMMLHWEALESSSENKDWLSVVRTLRLGLMMQGLEDLEGAPDGAGADKADRPPGPAADDPRRRSVETGDYLIITPDPQLPNNEVCRQPQDDYERQLLEDFARVSETATARAGYRERFSGDTYEYYQPIYAKEGCSNAFCHRPDPVGSALFNPTSELGAAAPGNRPWEKGQLMGIVHVPIPNAPVQAEVNRYWSTLLAVAIVTAFLAMIAFYVTIRYLIVRPLKHLHDVSDAVSRGNIALRAEIHTGDEFEGLGLAFNRMLRHLVTIQDELRQVNADLDGKLDELARMNMQLYEMNRIKSDFLATMSHELRTPLNSILGFSDVLGSIDALDEKQKRYVQNIQKSGRMLLEMINNILDLAKIESGRMEIRLSEFPIEQVVAAQCDMARPLSEKKNIDLETRIEPELPLLYQDQARVQQILNNLLSNAIKFTPEGGRITVSAARNEREQLVLRVIDTGVGIAEEDQQVIFEKFRQGRAALAAGDAMTREYSGTGLGLSIVRELCKLLEGDIAVESQLGTGSTFTVHLPWRLAHQPRLDGPLTPALDRLGTRLDVAHEESASGRMS